MNIVPLKPQRDSKPQNGRFPSKIALHFKKVCYRVSLCEDCKRQSCKAFTGIISSRAKTVRGRHPLYVNIWPKLTNPFKNADFQSIFAIAKEVQLIPLLKKYHGTTMVYHGVHWYTMVVLWCTLILP